MADRLGGGHPEPWDGRGGPEPEGAASGTGSPSGRDGGLAGVPGRVGGSGEAPGGSERVGSGDPDGLAKLLAFNYAVPQIESEGDWARLTYTQRAAWRGDAEMVRGYLVKDLGWRAP